ncbi:putative DNA binding helix-turn helix protein (plasmid) [Aliivibrio wodanis]|uniref:Putative DNA binding helix-turn helix protein n=1 Tax=Aliivibrio wodanis TaxID=80852 RepID=A0A090I8J2_9GAMM|nr:putative DNA binding helix-turn helix protein [Aliivibrio wodanis]
MPKYPASSDLHLKKHNVIGFFERLDTALRTTSVNKLSKKTDISVNTIKSYLYRHNYPDLPRLATIAEHTGYSLSWLLFGHEKTQHKQDRFELTILDDAMTPTLPEGAEVVYQTLTPTSNSPVLDGIYVIATARGNLVRRLQWREDDKAYLVLCTNVDYPSQTMKSVNIIGKVTAVMTAI